MFVDLAIPEIPFDQLTYLVPDHLSPLASIGQRMSAPVGKRVLVGFCIALRETVNEKKTLRPILEILDEEPVVTNVQLDLARWTASYYCCSIGDALKACLPQGMMQKAIRKITLATEDEDLLHRGGARSRIRQAILDLLRTGEVLTEDELRARLGVAQVGAQLRALEAMGTISISVELERPKAHARLMKTLRILPPWTQSSRMHELMTLLERKATKQVDLLTVLWQALKQGEERLPMAEALKLSNTSHSQAQALAEKDVIAIEEVEMVRRPELRFAETLAEVELNPAQRCVAEELEKALDAASFAAFLLHGVTAGGKTLLYIEAARAALKRGKTALILVPEIALTPQLQYRFSQAFGKDVVVVHSRLTLGERHDAWNLIRQGKARVVLGVRSAVFVPLPHPGLIVVDEEHEPSYKQSDLSPRYHARDVAVMRARMEHATVVLGSATPSAESWENARRGKYRLISLPERMDGAELPEIRLINVNEERRLHPFRGAATPRLLEEITRCIGRGEGVILFQNRRGYAPSLECDECGHVETCDNCSISLTFHKDREQMRCHYCGDGRPVPPHCPQCGSSALSLVGTGTQRIEEELAESLNDARLIRMDADSTRKKGAHDIMLSTFGEGEADILLGTQMVAKGLDFHRVTLVGVISADQSLLMPDFRAAERTFQLLTQVAGRAGRGELPGVVYIQTQRPLHPVYARVITHDFLGFMEHELESRAQLRYPPFARLILLTFSDPDEGTVIAHATAWFQALSALLPDAEIHAPHPAMIKRLKRYWRYQIMIRIDKRRDPYNSRFHAAFTSASTDLRVTKTRRRASVTIDVDPHDMF